MAEADPQSSIKTALRYEPVFAIRLDAFLRVKPFVSTEETRYYLNGIAVQPCPEGGALCIATDGHRMGIRRDVDGWCGRDVIVKVPRELKAPAKSLFNTAPWLVLMASGAKGHLSLVPPENKSIDDVFEAAISNVEDAILRFGDVVIDGTFPDWRRVVEHAKPQKGVGFNGAYLGSFGRHVVVSQSDDLAEPRLIRDQSDKNFVGMLMPMRVDGDKSKPSWLEIAQKAAA